jgi:U4/U6 small nuclear ribonucleoprotein PRP4
MRALKCLHTIPAHKSSVSDLRFYRTPAILDQPTPSTNGDVDMDASDDKPEQDTKPDEPISRNGLYLVTSGFDSTVRIWSADDWQLVKSLATNAGKVMSVDVSRDGKYIASASYNRSFHLFGPE